MKTSKNKIRLSHIIYLVLFILILVSVRWSWHDWLSLSNPPTVKQGLLDLRGIDLENQQSFPMDGDWLFYPGQWIGSTNSGDASDGQMLQVPGNWNAAFNPAQKNAYGYGTYYVKILLDRPLSEPLSIWFQSIYTASQVEINGEVLAEFGVLAESKDEHISETKSFMVTYAQKDQMELNVFVRAANQESPLQGGIVRSVQFGTHEVVNKVYLYSLAFQLIVCVIFMLHAMYALIIYLMNRRKKEFIIFFFLMAASAMTVAVHHHGLLFLWMDASFAWMWKIKAFAFMWFSFFLLLMGRGLGGIRRKGVLLYGYIFLLLAFTLFVAVGPTEMVLYSLEKGLYMILYYVPLFWTAYYFMRMVFDKGEGALFLVFSVVCVINNILWGTVYYAGTSQFMFYPIDLIAAITSFSAYWFKRYFNNSDENMQLNERLAETNRLKDRFLANTSHELRTPLHGIMNIAQSVLTRKKQVLDEQSQRDMELLVMVSRRMSHMLNDLLDVVRLQEKRISVRLTKVNVQSVAAGVLDMLRFSSEGTKVELRMNIPEDLPHVDADEERLVQILINLVHNALKYTQNGFVELSAKYEKGQVLLQIRDTGAGMDEIMQKRAFIPYEQGSFGGGGMGLGLSICKELVELHGSKLLLQSQPGKGSVFSFKLAVHEERSQPSAPLLSPPAEMDSEAWSAALVKITSETAAMVASSNTSQELDHISKLSSAVDQIRVLAVDDDSINLKVLTHILSTENYYIGTANSAGEALDKLHQDQWDLVIADVMMPGMSGYELTRLIRERFTLYELPIILLTARSKPEDIYTGFRAGANDYVTKPVDGLELKYRAWSLSSLKQAVNDRLRMEAAYLQAQIHPHFLFNTLNSITALSEIDSDKMRKLVEAFTFYLRISFDFLTAGKLVSLSRELQLVENYLYIEQQRFEERLQIEWDVKWDRDDVLIPPLTIQPLVENAVRHGILSKAKGGTLSIRIKSEAGAIRVTISDTGIGMNGEQVAKLLSPVGKEERGIGLFNTHSRLTQLYGQGLHIQSEPGAGTAVSFTIPVKD
ncbi:ATP-binding protein [Paenibacillus luteus]|uniref:hybrid sensor histidine kinase/response regulator n=1 Tax=Paenibacillus luteus TaxID=2545753 RepID=UPI00114300D0|nr:ATP-binding protein [Paenibacillus luteus]